MHAPGREGTTPLDAEREARVTRLGKELRCAVCQGSSIADSPASMARAQLDKVRELVAEGKSDPEIMDYFVARYGEFVLMRPRPTGTNLLIYLGPGALLLFGLYFIWKLKSAPAPAAQRVTPSVVDAPADDFLAAVRDDVKK